MKQHRLMQLEKFPAVYFKIEEEGLSIPMKHCSNSAGIIRMKEANMDAVRAGIHFIYAYASI